MKRLLWTLSFLLLVTVVMAVPAKPGIWKTITLTDGTEVRVQLCGDEHAHYWMTSDGRCYIEGDDEIFVPVTADQLEVKAQSRRAGLNAKTSNRLQSPRKVSMGERTHYYGKKKGLVILAQFTDMKFKSANNLEKYKKIMNQEGYNEGSFKGSVSDFFHAQSNGQFELFFDVVGPYTMKNGYSYYGANTSSGDDMRPEEMIIEACQQADAEVNFADYDWDGDKEVDQVFVLYAGKGEADGGAKNTIWPHMYTLGETKKYLSLDGVKIDTYACSNEIMSDGSIEGIGCFCHEFSHCMGFPDFYDTSYSGWMGMGSFDLMCSGSYNGNTFCPAGYTAHEKMMCGWQEPTVLSDKDVEVTNLQPMSNHGETFIIYNDAHPDEYYMIENRQQSGFDASYPAKGLMITHVDFDLDIWKYNIPNTKVAAGSDYAYWGFPLNDHQRMVVVPADNSQSSYNQARDLYPYGSRDSLTATSKPAATFYNKTSTGSTTADWAIVNITQNANGTMSFKYRAPGSTGSDDPTPKPDPQPGGENVFYESFDKCAGTGGNDNLWSGSAAVATFLPDNDGWQALSDKYYGASQCARFGTSKSDGIATTPSFTLNGEATLTFRAAAWNANVDGTSLLVESDNATVSPSTFTMKKGEWTNFTATVNGKGKMTLTFTPGKRFFLDEVKVVTATVNGIEQVKGIAARQGIYTLNGRYVGTDTKGLPHGLYILNGKKFVK